MAVSVNIAREGVEIAWEPGDYEGPVRIKAVNVENGDVGVTKSTNDGKAFLTWPPGTWSDHITVYSDTPHAEGQDSEPDVIDEGDITVTVG